MNVVAGIYLACTSASFRRQSIRAHTRHKETGIHRHDKYAVITF